LVMTVIFIHHRLSAFLSIVKLMIFI